MNTILIRNSFKRNICIVKASRNLMGLPEISSEAKRKLFTVLVREIAVALVLH